jgi:hypothetical protein
VTGCFQREIGFEFNWRAVAEGGVEAFGIVDGVDEDADETSCVLDVLEAAAVDFFGFEGLHARLAFTIMPERRSRAEIWR